MADARKIDEGLTVNDGGGFLDTDGMIDALIIKANDAVKEIVSGQYLSFCNIMAHIGQGLLALKTGVKSELDSARAKTDELKRANDALMQQVSGLTVQD